MISFALRLITGHWTLITFLHVGLGFRQADDFLAFLELAALLQQFDTLETFQNVPLRGDGAGSFKTAMLRHNCSCSFGDWSAHLTTLRRFFKRASVIGARLHSSR